jgi:hypothetical protein
MRCRYRYTFGKKNCGDKDFAGPERIITDDISDERSFSPIIITDYFFETQYLSWNEQLMSEMRVTL